MGRIKTRAENGGASRWRAKVARVTGLEPATSGVTGRRSNQLSYTRIPAGPSLGSGCLGEMARPVKRPWHHPKTA